MNSQHKKTLLIGLGIFAALLLAVAAVYFVRKPTTPVVAPPPTPTPSPISTLESPVAAPVFVVDQISACSTSFTVACVSPSPSPSVSPSPSPSGSPSAPPSTPASASPSTPPSAALKCMSKKMYEDDSRNQSGFYYLEREITSTGTIQSGQVIVYNVVAKNAGGNTAPETTITDKLADSLTYLDGDSGCTYDSPTRTVTCTIGALSPNSEAQRSFRVRVSATGTISVANTAEVASTNGQRDSCSVQIDATGKVITTTPSEAPAALPVAGVFEITAGTIGVGFLLLLAGVLGILLI